MNDDLTPDTLFERGLPIRRAVLGEAFVDGALADANEFTAVFQRMTTELAWGYAWARPGLDPRTRSLLNLAMLTALRAPAELKLHVRGAVANGVTPAEIAEVLLHASIYCGIPAGQTAFKAANEVLVEAGLVSAMPPAR